MPEDIECNWITLNDMQCKEQQWNWSEKQPHNPASPCQSPLSLACPWAKLAFLFPNSMCIRVHVCVWLCMHICLCECGTRLTQQAFSRLSCLLASHPCNSFIIVWRPCPVCFPALQISAHQLFFALSGRQAAGQQHSEARPPAGPPALPSSLPLFLPSFFPSFHHSTTICNWLCIPLALGGKRKGSHLTPGNVDCLCGLLVVGEPVGRLQTKMVMLTLREAGLG